MPGIGNYSVFVKADCFQRDHSFWADSDAPSATGTVDRVNRRHIRHAGYIPKSICFHVNEGLDCLRLNG